MHESIVCSDASYTDSMNYSWNSSASLWPMVMQSSAGELNLRFHTKYWVVLFQFFLTYIDKNPIFKKHKICFYLLAKILHVCACALFRLPRSQREKFLPWHKNECLILFSNYMYWYDIWNRYNIAKLRLLNAIFIRTKVLMI